MLRKTLLLLAIASALAACSKGGDHAKPDASATAQAGKDGKDGKDAPARPSITQAMQSYLDLHRHGVVRLAVIARPPDALRLMIAHAIAASGNWRVSPVARFPAFLISATL